MGRLFEGFEIVCTDYDRMLEKVGTLFKGGHYVREDINQGNTVFWKIPQNNNPVGWKQLLKINKPVGRNKHVCWKNSSKLISL